MSKVIAIGDIHGKNVWKEIVKQEADKFVFIGDYLDSYDVSGLRQKENFEQILEYKSQNKDKVVLLIGNHDYHYLPGVNSSYSGFQDSMLPMFRGMLKRAIKEKLMQVCYVEDNVIYTHAGITKTWANDNNINTDNIQKQVNDLFTNDISKFGFQLKRDKYSDPYGDNIFQSPLWVRPQSLCFDKLDGFKQVVGHTIHDDIAIFNDIAFIDVLDKTKQYLKIIDGKFKKS